jgi:cystathionine beta-lyase
MVQHRATAVRLIEWLQTRPEVERVLYPPLPDDPGHALWKRDMTGASGLFGVVLRAGLPAHAVDVIADRLRLFGRGASWGGVESLVLPAAIERAVTPFPFRGRLFRLAAGLEDPDDLIADLAQAFDALRHAR